MAGFQRWKTRYGAIVAHVEPAGVIYDGAVRGRIMSRRRSRPLLHTG